MLDVDYVRSQFPQLADDPALTFCANAGGSYVARPVLDLLDGYHRHMRVQPYSPFAPSDAAGAAMDHARNRWADALNVKTSELIFAPSTSTNTYVMAHAMGQNWGPGDEIVVTQQDHEANQGAWRRKAESQGARVREWTIDPESGLLDPAALNSLLNERTRWVFFTHCSNVIGTVNPVREIVRIIRTGCDARVCVDGVAYAPHHVPDLSGLDVDVYLLSLYKVYGPHQGLMYVRESVAASLAPQSHYFLSTDPARSLNPSGPQHAEIAASAGVLDYFAQLIAHHKISPALSLSPDLQALHEIMSAHERTLTSALLDYLSATPHVRVLGKPHCNDHDRAATIAFVPRNASARAVAGRLHANRIGAESGHFYAHRVLTHLGIDPSDGVVRISLVHYNTAADADRIVAALEQSLG